MQAIPYTLTGFVDGKIQTVQRPSTVVGCKRFNSQGIIVKNERNRTRDRI